MAVPTSISNLLYANPLQFANEAGLYALLSIIPLILIYLLRPRPLKIRIPSLMFLMEIEKKRRFNIIRKFLKDPLFFIQLLVLILISLAVAAPFIMAQEEVGGGHTVIILDASASMQADGRFEKAQKEANNFLSSKNTVILAESVPVMVVKEAPAGSTKDALGKLKVKATGSDLSSAILLGRRMLPEGGRMVVFSDFASWMGDDPGVAKKMAEANGINVEYITITGRTDNIGIINGWFESGNDYKIIVKNFNKDAKNVKIDVTTNKKNVITSTLNLNGQSSEYFEISDLGSGNTKITIESDDALSVDNNAYIIIPPSIEKDILYFTDNENLPSILALGLNPFSKVKQVNLKSVPSMSGYSTVIVSGTISSNLAQSLSDYAAGGGNVLVIASFGLENNDFLPVVLDGISNKTSLNIVRPSRMTEGIDVDRVEVKKHFKASLKSGAIVFVEGGDGSAMLAYWKFGKGQVIYSGLADPRGNNIFDPLNENVWNDFHALPEYPLFWKQLLEWISGSLDVTEYNARTGTFIRFPATSIIKTPGDKVTTDVLLLDEVGIYELPDKDVAVNLFNEGESNLAGKIEETAPSGNGDIPYTVATILKPKHFDIYLIIGGMLFVLFELYYLRWRGEL